MSLFLAILPVQKTGLCAFFILKTDICSLLYNLNAGPIIIIKHNGLSAKLLHHLQTVYFPIEDCSRRKMLWFSFHLFILFLMLLSCSFAFISHISDIVSHNADLLYKFRIMRLAILKRKVRKSKLQEKPAHTWPLSELCFFFWVYEDYHRVLTPVMILVWCFFVWQFVCQEHYPSPNLKLPQLFLFLTSALSLKDNRVTFSSEGEKRRRPTAPPASSS